MSSVASVLSECRYHDVDRCKAEGAHYTPSELADFVAANVLSAAKALGGMRLRVLDPAVGDGELLVSLIRRLHQAGCLKIEAHGFDTSDDALGIAKNRLLAEFPTIKLNLHRADFLDYATEHFEGTNGSQRLLFNNGMAEPFDVVIANPPYVRTQVLGASTAQNLAQRFGLSGRVDLYYAFIYAIAMALRAGGVLGIIVSNRFMTTRSGANVRAEIRKRFNICHVWDLGDTKIFNAAVLPAVLLMRRADTNEVNASERFTSIYSCNPVTSADQCGTVYDALDREGIISIADGRHFRVLQGSLAPTSDSRDLWRVSTDDSDDWLERVSRRTWGTFSDIGKIRVGVKTTADSIFIRDDWAKECGEELPELLQPLITHHIARRYRALTPSSMKQILYPHEVKGGKRQAVDLSRYPKARHYLEKNKDSLAGRKYVIEAGRKWFEIWVPHDPKAWDLPKLVWRDISERPVFWVDEGQAVVNGDCYWMVCSKKADEPLLWLAAAVGNSRFIEKFYDHRFNNKLYAGRRRFITQYVNKFPLPNPRTPVAQKIIEAARAIYLTCTETDSAAAEREVDELVWTAFDLPVEEI